MRYSTLLSAAAAMAWAVSASSDNMVLALLDAIAQDPDLTILTGVLRNTSASFTRNPEFYERFNEPLDLRRFTFFAPTDAAFAKLSPAAVGALLNAPNYEPLKLLLRAHIGEGFFNSTIVTSSSVIPTVEGLGISVNGTLLNGVANIVAVDLPASNGVYHKIDAVLNPLGSYFGKSQALGEPPKIYASDTSKSLIQMLAGREDTSLWFSLNEAVAPYVKIRVAYEAPLNVPALSIFVIPASSAYLSLPKGGLEQFRAPSNNAFSQWLLRFGRLEAEGFTRETSGSAYEVILELVRQNGGTWKTTDLSGVAVVVTETSNGELFLGNARVLGEFRGSNGAVWLLDRVADPYIGTLGY